MTLDQITALCAPHGLMPMAVAEEGAGSVVLLGPDNRVFWRGFSRSPEAKDGTPHPLDRWSKRVITALAVQLNATPVFPCEGPPYAPFLRWASESGSVWPSPIGPFVGAETGLWISFRGALILAERLPKKPETEAPCQTCARPCTQACPVGAFEGGRYDADRCRAHIATPAGQVCLTKGCLARAACPVGPDFAPPPAQAELHMTAFLNSSVTS
ncbi:MAG: ferredoxin [Pseudomonadota bacterium]